MRAVLRILSLVVASLLAIALVVELGLRAFGLSYPLFMRADPTLGWSFHPEVAGWSVHENTAWLEINAAGFRDVARDPAKDPSTFRVAVLGDSMIDGSNVAFEATVTSVMARELERCPALTGRPVEVLNFGLSGHGTSQAYVLLRQTVLDYRPDLVVLAFYMGNDVANNARELSEGYQKLRPFHVLREGRLVLDDSFRETAEYDARWRQTALLGGIVNRSYLLQVLKQIHLGALRLPGEAGETARFDPERDRDHRLPPETPEMFGPPPDAVWARAWAVTEVLILAIREAIEAGGGHFLTVLIPAPLQVYPDAAVRAASADANGAQDLSYPDARLAALARRHGVELLALREPMLGLIRQDPIFLFGFPPNLGYGHLNEAGNERVGTLTATRICDGIRAGN